MSEEICGIDVDYNSRMVMAVDGDSLTASLFEYLKYKEVNVVKATYPVIKYDNQVVEMMTISLPKSDDMSYIFDGIYQHIMESKPKTVFIYMMKINYMFGKEAVYDDEFNISSEGEPILRTHGILRYGVINE